MRWPDGSRRQQPYGTGDQELEVGKSVRQKFLPCTPSHCSGEKLVDCILMRCFGQPELGDALLPIIRHCQRRAHTLSCAHGSGRTGRNHGQGLAVRLPVHCNVQ